MMMDKKMQFADAQALTSQGTIASSNVIDLGVDRDIGIGYPLEVDARVMTTFTSGGAATLQMQIITSASENMSSPTILYTGPAHALASLVAGFELGRPRINSVTQRYLRINWIVATADFTAGAVSANVVLDRQANRSYVSGIPNQV